jgi:hypothetical protein
LPVISSLQQNFLQKHCVTQHFKGFMLAVKLNKKIAGQEHTANLTAVISKDVHCHASSISLFTYQQLNVNHLSSFIRKTWERKKIYIYLICKYALGTSSVTHPKAHTDITQANVSTKRLHFQPLCLTEYTVVLHPKAW